MDDYLILYGEMISLRGLTDHTVKSYSTYISAYLDYLQQILTKMPEDISWAEPRDNIRWLRRERTLSDCTINHCISQFRFFTIYVLHKKYLGTMPGIIQILHTRRLELNYHPHVHASFVVVD